MKRYELIMIDMDGTLINSLPFHFKSFKQVLNSHKIKVDDKKLKLMMGKPTIQILNELKQELNFPENPHTLKEEKKERFVNLIAGKNTLFPSIEKTLQELKKHHKIALATGSTQKELFASFDKTLFPLFDFISTMEDIQHPKPAPDQFLYIAKALTIDPKNCLTIGDSIYDALASEAAGIDFIAVTTGYTSESIHKKYKHLAILPSISALPSYLTKQAKYS